MRPLLQTELDRLVTEAENRALIDVDVRDYMTDEELFRYAVLTRELSGQCSVCYSSAECESYCVTKRPAKVELNSPTTKS